MHRDDDIEKELRSGLTPAEARRRAALEFTHTKEAIRDQDSWRVLESVLRDLRFAVRSLRRTPVFALTAAVVLGLGSAPTRRSSRLLTRCCFGPCLSNEPMTSSR
jgi:hypothetical protein